MKAGISSWSFPGGLADHGPADRQTKTAGFDGIKLALSSEGCLIPSRSDVGAYHDITAADGSLRENAVRLPSSACPTHCHLVAELLLIGQYVVQLPDRVTPHVTIGEQHVRTPHVPAETGN